MFGKFSSRSSSADREELVTGFLSVRRTLGLLGLFLPVLLYAHARILPGGEMKPSISEFYHTAVGDILVGILVAIGVFLISYVGHKPQPGDKLTDWWVSTIAGAGAIGVAIFPTTPTGTVCSGFVSPDVVQGIVSHWCQWWGPIHFVSATAFFFCMALFCLRLFPKNAEGNVRYFDERSNTIYLVCGIVLLLSIAGLAAFFFIRNTTVGVSLAAGNFVFWFETLGVLAFAFAWLEKGKLLGSRSKFGRTGM